MEIKIPEALCKLCLEDMETAMQLEKAGQMAVAKGNSLMDQARGIQMLVQGRVYKTLDLAPVEGDMLNFAEGRIDRKEPPAPVDPPDPPASDWFEPPANES